MYSPQPGGSLKGSAGRAESVPIRLRAGDSFLPMPISRPAIAQRPYQTAAPAELATGTHALDPHAAAFQNNVLPMGQPGQPLGRADCLRNTEAAMKRRGGAALGFGDPFKLSTKRLARRSSLPLYC